MQAFTETEIKLEAAPETLDALMQHPLLRPHLAVAWRRLMLYNQYYDTADLALDRADLALRVRRDGEQYIQTLKGRGQSVDGLSVRDEWDWYLTTAQLQLELLEGACWPPALQALDKTRLQPLFRTDFSRDKALLRWHWQETAVSVEVALDRGEVVTASGARAPICELELELHEGPQAALLALAESLRAQLPLYPCDTSKAERGYRLVRGQAPGVAKGPGHE